MHITTCIDHHLNKIKKIKGVEVIRQPLFFTDVLRQDVEKQFPNQQAILSNMPAEEDGYLRIPKVGEEEVNRNHHRTSAWLYLLFGIRGLLGLYVSIVLSRIFVMITK